MGGESGGSTGGATGGPGASATALSGFSGLARWLPPGSGTLAFGASKVTGFVALDFPRTGRAACGFGPGALGGRAADSFPFPVLESAWRPGARVARRGRPSFGPRRSSAFPAGTTSGPD